jgi:signal peptidase
VKQDLGRRRSRAKVSPARKVFAILKNIFVWLVAITAVAMMIFTIISVLTFDRNDRDLFGYKALIIRSDSMSATDFKAGDLILVKEVDPSTLKEGDIIAYQSTATESFGETITHKIRSLTVSEDGSPAFITYGTTTNVNDPIPVTYDYVLGKYEVTLPGIGIFFAFLKTIPGYIICILLPFLFLIVTQSINTVRLYQQYKRQQQEELKSELDQIEAKKEELQRMMEELKQMRAQMGMENNMPFKGKAPNESPDNR